MSREGRVRVYVGCGNPSGEIQIFAMEPDTCELVLADSVASGSSTSFMAVHPSKRFVYTTQNRADALTAFALNPATGGLVRLGQVPVKGAEGAAQAGPAYVTTDAHGRFLLAANYRGNNVVVHRLDDNGHIGALLQSIGIGTHAHSVRLDPSNRFAFAAFLGADRVAQWRFDEHSGRLSPNDPPWVMTAQGGGPRHLDFHPNHRWVYLVDELDSVVHVYALDGACGTLTELEALSALPAGYAGRRWSGDIHVAPSGRFLYVSNRAHESIALFAIDAATGRLTLLAHEDTRGKTPRNFTFDPSGRFLLVANQDSANLVTFAVDEGTGRLSHICTQAVGESPYYVCAIALPGAC